MELLGVGPLELIFILLIALIVLGPQDMAKAGRTIGRFLRKTILSPTWIDIQRKIRTLPNHLMREAGLDEEELKRNLTVEGMDLNAGARKTPLPSKTHSRQAPSTQTIGKPVAPRTRLGRRPDSLAVPSEWTSLPAPEPPVQEAAPPAEWITPPAIETSNPGTFPPDET